MNHPLRQPRYAVPLAAVLLAVNLPFLHLLLRGAAPVLTAVPYQDAFDRASLGDQWWSNGGAWRIVNGQLYSPGVGNNPLWLKARLPQDVRIEFDVRSEGSDGDIKWEAFGDGRNHSTGYVFLYGAWHNRESRICKLDEHALTLPELRTQLSQLARPYPHRLEGLDALWESVHGRLVEWQAKRDLQALDDGRYIGPDTPFVVKRLDAKVEKGKTYHMSITRRQKLLRWEIDGVLALEMNDPAPLFGKGHDRFGFSSWQNDTYFDNLKITPL